MDKKKGILEYSFWIHLVIIGALFLMPLSFAAPDESLSLTAYLRRLVMPATILFVFYTNYYWVVPIRLMKNHDRQFFWLFNLVMLIILAVALTYWSEHMHHLRVAEDLAAGISRPGPMRRAPGMRFLYFGFIRDFYNLAVAVALATVLRMSHRWIELEKQSKESEVALREAELNNLRNQINSQPIHHSSGPLLQRHDDLSFPVFSKHHL